MTVEGLTQASSVIPLDSCSDAEFGIVTSVLVPLNFNAPPYLPVVDQVPFATVPLLPFPEASVTVEPDPSLKPYAATRPELAAAEFCMARSPVPPAAVTVNIATAAPTSRRRDRPSMYEIAPSYLTVVPRPTGTVSGR